MVTRFHRCRRWNKPVTKSPTRVPMYVVMRSGTNTSVGSAAPSCARKVKMVTGSRVTDAVLITRNRICASLAVSGDGLSFCSSCIALMPSGVAALSSPSMLAPMFMVIAPSAGWLGGTSGNRRRNSGARPRVSTSSMPARSPIFITPSHNAITPVKPSAISNAVLLLANSAFTSAAKMSASPRKTSLKDAIRKAARKKPIHSALSIRV